MPVISSKMTRDMFFKLRNSLKFVDDLAITEEIKKADILWKVRPLGKASLPQPPKDREGLHWWANHPFHRPLSSQAICSRQAKPYWPKGLCPCFSKWSYAGFWSVPREEYIHWPKSGSRTSSSPILKVIYFSTDTSQQSISWMHCWQKAFQQQEP